MELERPATRGQQERPTTRWRREDRPTTRDSANVLDNHFDASERGYRAKERPMSRRGMLSRQVKSGVVFSIYENLRNNASLSNRQFITCNTH
jgi:hypothetical protein